MRAWTSTNTCIGGDRALGRSARAISLGGGSLVLATGAHLAGGGRLPPLGVLLVLTFVVGLTAVTLTARRLRLGVLLPVLLVEQALLHVVLDAASMFGSGCPRPGPLAGHAAAMTGCLPGHAASGSGGNDGLMMVAHLAATLATAWLLARGERWWWRQWDRAVDVATWSATPRVRRPRLARPLPVRVLLGVDRALAVGPRGPPIAVLPG